MDRKIPSFEAVITFIEGDNSGSEFKVEAPAKLLIGRSEECDILIAEKKVSRKHAKLTINDDGVSIEDLGSTNGTFVDAKKITNVDLKDGATVRIGMSAFKVNIIGGKPLTLESAPIAIPVQKDGVDDQVENAFDLISEDSLDKPVEPLPSGKAVEKKKPLSGNLSEMALPDLLQVIKSNQRSGVLEIIKGVEQGKIYFVEGKLVSALIGEVLGAKSMFRMLAFDEGDFEFHPLPEDFDEGAAQGKIDMSLESILIEGMRQIDEFEKIKKGLPSLDSVLVLKKEFEAPLSKLHPKVLDILQLVLNHEKFQEVMNKSQLSDLETGKIVYYLIKKGYIVTK